MVAPKFAVLATSNLTGDVRKIYYRAKWAALLRGALLGLGDVDVQIIDCDGRVLWEFYGSDY